MRNLTSNILLLRILTLTKGLIYGMDERGVIQDISKPWDGKVHSIGRLDDEWRRQAKMAKHGLGYIPYSIRQQRPKLATEQPEPLAGSPAEAPETKAIRIKWYAPYVALMTGAFGAAKHFADKVHWRPTKYTLPGGVVTDWHTKTFERVKVLGTPMLALLLLCLILTVTWRPVEQTKHHGSVPHIAVHTIGSTQAPATSANNANNVSGIVSGSDAAGSPSGNTYRATPSQVPVMRSQSVQESTTPVTNSNPVVNPQPTSGIPGVTTPETVTVPPEPVVLGGKQIASTGAVPVTLN